MINAAEARAIIVDAVHPLGTISVSLDHSLGCILAETIIAAEQTPPFDNAQMDGYAVRSEDIGTPPVALTIIGEVAAGAITARALQHGEAMSIMTGAKIPDGCDAVVQQEWTERGENTVKILRSAPGGHNIRKAGADIALGSQVFIPGQSLRPREIGMLASLGKRYVSVYRPVSVTILPTGNEIVEIDKPLREGTIRNSNAHTLTALVRELGGEAHRFEIVPDDKTELRRRILEGLNADVLITTGGVSVGKYDLVMESMKEIGVDIKFWKVNIKPGMPLLFGMYGATPVFGLPGNPVSTMVTFLQFVRPALMKMMGHNKPDTSLKFYAKLEHEIKKSDGKRHYMRGIAETKNGSLMVCSTGPQVSNILSSLVKANCLIIIPEDKAFVAAGEEVEIELL